MEADSSLRRYLSNRFIEALLSVLAPICLDITGGGCFLIGASKLASQRWKIVD